MRLVVNKIVSEFNKIFAGTKRVGDSLRLEGKRENQLDVYNSSLLGLKTESTLNVSHSVNADKVEKIRSVGIDGEPDVNKDGEAVYKTENNLSVKNTQYLRGVSPENLEVDISRRLKVGDSSDSPIINVSSLIINPNTYTVRDSSLLGGKTENTLNVNHADTASNSDLLNGVEQSNLKVLESNQSLYLKRTDGTLVPEEDLFVKSTELIRKGTNSYDLYTLRQYILEHDNAKNIIPKLASSSNTLTTTDGNKSWSDLVTIMKDNTDSEIYKTSHLIVSSDTNAPVKTGDEFKNWIIAHDDFKAKVGTLESNLSKRSVRFGTDQDNKTISEFRTEIKGYNVKSATNADKLDGYHAADIFTTIRSRILSDASNDNTGLTTDEVDGFFDNTKVKIKVQNIKVKKANNADTLETLTVDNIKQAVKDEGKVLSAKYLYETDNGGQISYARITSDISDLETKFIDDASLAYRNFKKVEDIIKDNKSSIENSLATEQTTRETNDNSLGDRIDTEKGRIDTIVDVSTSSDPKTFKKMKEYTDNVDTNLNNKITQNTEDINTLKTSSTDSIDNLQTELDDTQIGSGLASNGNYIQDTDREFIDDASSLADADKLLDIALKNEKAKRSSDDNKLLDKINTLSSNINTEKITRETNDGDLTKLDTDTKDDLVSAINEVHTELDSEIVDRGSADTELQNNINAEKIARETNDGDLTKLDTDTKDDLVSAINEVHTDINTTKTDLNSEISDRTTSDNNLQTNIDNEKTARETNDGDLTKLDTDTKDDLVSAINEVHTDINSVSADLNSESTSRSNADNTLQDHIDTVSSDLSTEIDNRKDADNTINSTISDISTRIDSTQSAIGSINETNGEIEITNTNFLDGQTTVISALKEIDTKVVSNYHIQETLILSRVVKDHQLYADQIVNADSNVLIGTRYYVDVSDGGITLTLPEGIQNFDRILFHGLKGDFEINNLIITRVTDNTDTIMGSEEDLIVETNNETFTLVYVNSDWRIL